MKIYRIALGLAAICLGAALITAVVGVATFTGPMLIAFFIMLAIGFRGVSQLKGSSFTVIIFAATTAAMYYPSYFVQWGGFKLVALITPLLQLIMFGMGTEIGLNDLAGVFKMPRAVFIGLLGHYTFMPLAGFTLALIFKFPPEIGAGVVLVGCMPCGMASNVMSYLAKANLALSVTLTAVSTLLSPLLSPLLMKLLGGQFIQVKTGDMMWDIVRMVIIPLFAGLIFNRYFKGKVRWLDKTLSLVSMFGIAFIIVIIVASGRNSLLTIGPALMLCAFLHNTSGYLFGYWMGRLLRLGERDARTIAIEVGMQNSGLASALAKAMGKAATLGLPAAIFGPIMNISGSVLASYWHRHPPVVKEKTNTTANLSKAV